MAVFYDVGQGQAWQRIIPVTERSHLPSHVRQWWGDSRGHWEEETLVVDVTNFSPKSDFLGARENLHLTERWRRLDANTLEYVVTIEDPTTWTRPWTARQEMTIQDGRRIGSTTSPGVTRGITACRGSWWERALKSKRSLRGGAQIRPRRTQRPAVLIPAVWIH